MLCTLGKDRGFTERQEIVTAGDDMEALRRQIEEDIRRVYGDEDWPSLPRERGTWQEAWDSCAVVRKRV